MSQTVSGAGWKNGLDTWHLAGWGLAEHGGFSGDLLFTMPVTAGVPPFPQKLEPHFLVGHMATWNKDYIFCLLCRYLWPCDKGIEAEVRGTTF